MLVYLIRHAEGENSHSNWQTPETPLSEKGKKQAENLGFLPRFKNIDLILTSKWTRSLETAQILAEKLRKPHQVFKDIEERHQSAKIYGLSRHSKLAKQYSEGLTKHINNLDWKFNNDEESFRDVSYRSIAFKKNIIRKYSSKTLIVVSHEHFLTSFITACLLGDNYSDELYLKLVHSFVLVNTGVSLLEFREKHKKWRVWYINDFSHFKILQK